MANKMPTKKAVTDRGQDGYPKFIESLQLYTIGLCESECSINRADYWGGEEARDITYEMTAKASSVGDDAFDAKASLTLSVTGEKSKKVMVRISVSFDLHFHAKTRNKEFVERFCESEIRLIVWPYFREYVSSTIGRMHVPPIILPTSNKSEDSSVETK